MPATADGSQQNGLHNHRTKGEHGTKWHLIADDRADLVAIDAAIDRMRSLTAPDPYVLTIPQDAEPRYHHAFRSQAQQWLSNSPFSPKEHENLQYQTFFFYEHGKQMFVLQNSRPQEPKPPANDGTGANTPTAGPKKKITLDAYKKKQNGGSATHETASVAKLSDTKQAASKGPVERVKAETEEMLAAVAGAEREQSVLPKNEVRAEKNDLKRKREDKGPLTKDDKSGKSSDVRIKSEEQGPSKRAHRSPSPARSTNKLPSQSKTEPRSQAKSGYDETKLPPRLSPGMPPRLSPLGNPDSPKSYRDGSTPPLPSKLSPTIPENISNTLKARDRFLSATRNDETPRKSEDVTKRRSPVPRNGFRANSSSPAVRSDVEEKLRPITFSVQKKSQIATTPHEEQTDVKEESKAKAASLIVKLKYKKSQKEAITRLLRMRPVAAKRHSSPSPIVKVTAERSERGAGKLPSRQDGTSAEKTRKDATENGAKGPTKHESRTGGKRPFQEEHRNGPPTKRVDSKKEPSTPARSNLASPSPATRKNHVTLTPSSRKDAVPSFMKREISQDSFTTHHTPPATANTPNSNPQLHRPPSSQPTSRNTRQQAWTAEQMHLQDLGTTLKHDADVPDLDPRFIAAKAIESLICYILAFTCADQCSLSSDTPQTPKTKPWRTLMGFQHWVTRMCAVDPTLRMIGASLGVVWISHALYLAGKQTGTSDAFEERDYMHYISAMREHTMASSAFDADYLREKLPLAWKSRSQSELSTTPESSDPKMLLGTGSGDYNLPFGPWQAPPFRAARAAYKMLGEWTASHRSELSYTLKLALPDPANGA